MPMKKDRHAGSLKRRETLFRLLSFLCFAAIFFSCADLGTAPVEGLLADHSGIADPVQRWEAYSLEDYSIVQIPTCFCADGGRKFLVTVRSGSIAGIVDQSDGSELGEDRWGAFRTIPGLFALIESIDTAHVASFRFTYDPRYGYPQILFVDPSAQIADEEYGFQTELVH